jgi:hypothetical protein
MNSKNDKYLYLLLGGFALYFIVRTIQNAKYRKDKVIKYTNFGGYSSGDIAEEDPHNLNP